MGIYDRGYYGEGGDPYGRGGSLGSLRGAGFGRMQGWSVTTWIIVINVVVFVVDALLSRGNPMGGPLTTWGHFSTTTAILHGEVWRFITFQFLHGGVWHILFNMIALYFFGPLAESYLGSRRYLAFYLLTGMAGAALYLVLNVAGQVFTGIPGLLPGDPSRRLVGASAGIFGVLMAAAYIRPNEVITLLLFFVLPIQMRIKTLAYGLVVIALFVVFTGGSNAGGQAGHVGGAMLGALLIRKPNWLNWSLYIPPSKSRGPRNSRTHRPGYFETRRKRKAKALDEEVDRILAKVGTQGLQSLTSREKRILEQASDEKRRNAG